MRVTPLPPAWFRLKDIRRQTRRQYSVEEKIRIVLEGLRGEANIMLDRERQVAKQAHRLR